MPKGVYVRSPEQLARLREQSARASAAAAEYWRGRSRTPEQKAAHSARMRGRAPWNRGVEVGGVPVTHGHTVGGLSPTYVSWRSMMQRCTDPNATNYKYYGGRGIAVCDRWQSFEYFLADMGERPEGMTLGRIDNDGSYEPGNVEWVTRSENIAERNRRTASTSST